MSAKRSESRRSSVDDLWRRPNTNVRTIISELHACPPGKAIRVQTYAPRATLSALGVELSRADPYHATLEEIPSEITDFEMTNMSRLYGPSFHNRTSHIGE